MHVATDAHVDILAVKSLEARVHGMNGISARDQIGSGVRAGAIRGHDSGYRSVHVGDGDRGSVDRAAARVCNDAADPAQSLRVGGHAQEESKAKRC